MKRLIVAALLVLLFTASFPILAQDSLEYGTLVTSELTAETYEQSFTFVGSKDDAIVVEMRGIDPLNGLDKPELVLQDSEGFVLVNTQETFQYVGYGINLIAIQLPKDDTYTVIATRTDGADGDSAGEFTLQIILATPMESGKPYSGSVSSEADDYNYYIYSGDQSFSVAYERTGGDYTPEVSVNIIEETELSAIAVLAGDELTKGSMGVFQGGRTYFILVGNPLNYYGSTTYFQGETADYQVTLQFDE